MINEIIIQFIRFLLFVIVQVLVLNNIQLGGLFNPYLYVSFLLLLPFEIPGWLLLLLAFILGLSVDMFTDTEGMHAMACVFTAFCRPYLLKIIAPREGYEFETRPTIQHQGFRWFLTYASMLIFLHHLVLFYVEVFRLSEFFSTLLRVLLSSVLTLALVIVTQYLFFFRDKARK